MTLSVQTRDEGSVFKVVVDNQCTIPYYNASPGAFAWIKNRCGSGFHEPMMSELIYRFMRGAPSSRFFDVGALFGYFSLLALAASKGAADVHAFEMNPESADACTAMLVASKLGSAERIHVIHAAMSDCDDTGRATRYKGFFFDVNDSDSRSQALPHMRLDTYCAEHGVPDLVKMDVEGYEGKVLHGAEQILRTHRPNMLLELHAEKLLSPHGTSREEIIRFLLDVGYCAYHYPNHRVEEEKTLDRINAKWLELHVPKLQFMADDLIVLTKKPFAEVWPDLAPCVRENGGPTTERGTAT